jgi:hypothetical protein
MGDEDARATQKARRRLRDAFKQRRLTLFVGAGVSMASGLPGWRGLLTNVFVNSARGGLPDLTMDLIDAAIAEWFFKQGDAPLEILGRKIRASFGRQTSNMLDNLRRFLYFGTDLDWIQHRTLDAIRRDVLRQNPTLKAIVTLCRRGTTRKGVRRVVTYNYDNLLELMLPGRATQAICRATEPNPRALPIYHVHGYIPVEGTDSGSAFDDIILTEDQYNRVANDPYSWTNLVQLQAMSDSVGLIVGMSLNDRNLRRLLDATSRVATRPELYAFVERPRAPELSDVDVRTIARRAHEHYQFFLEHPDGTPPHRDPATVATADVVRGLLTKHVEADVKRLTSILSDLAIQPLWYDSFADIPRFLAGIAA